MNERAPTNERASRRRRRQAGRLLRACAAALLCGAALSACAVLLPDGFYQETLALIDRDDSVHPLALPYVSALKAGAVLGAVVLLSVSALLMRFRERLLRRFAALLQDLVRLGRELRFKRPSWALGIVFIAGAALRAVGLDAPMQFDEADTYNFFASRGYMDALSDYTAPNNHIFHTLLVRTSTLLFGNSPTVLRLPAFVGGLAVMPLAYLAGVRLFGAGAGLIAAAVTAFHPTLVFYSANARGYTIVAALTLALFAVSATIARRRSLAAWTLFIVLGTLGMFTIPTMLYSLAAAALWILASGRRPRAQLVREVSVAAAVIAAGSALLYTPAAVRTGVESIAANRFVRPQPWSGLAELWPRRAAEIYYRWTSGVPIAVLLALAAGLAASFRRSSARALWGCLLLSALGLPALQRVVPYARVFIYLVPLLALFVGVGLADLRRRWVPRVPAAALAVALCLAGALGVWEQRHDRPSQSIAGAVRTLAIDAIDDLEARQTIAAPIPYSEPIRYYLLRRGFPRARLTAPDPLTGDWPAFDDWPEIILIRPIDPPKIGAGKAWWLALDHPVLAEFEPVGEPRRLGPAEALTLARVE